MYSASMSGLAARLCSICSTSGHSQLGSGREGGLCLLVTLWFKISSSLTALSSSFLLPSSTTRTFHCEKRGESGIGRTEQSSLAYIGAASGTDRVQDDCIRCEQELRNRGERGGECCYLLSRWMLIMEVPILAGGMRTAWDQTRSRCW